jgi:hypothetical protein
MYFSTKNYLKNNRYHTDKYIQNFHYKTHNAAMQFLSPRLFVPVTNLKECIMNTHVRRASSH